MDEFLTVKRKLCVAWFVILGTLAFQGRFMSLFLRDRGFTDEEIGGILSLSPLLGAFTAPLFSYAADLCGVRPVYIVLVPMTVVAVNGYRIASHKLDGNDLLFTYASLYSVFSMCYQPIVAIFDASTLKHLRSINASTKEYGHARLWGAVGWGIVNAVIIGPIADLTNSTWFLCDGYSISAVCMLGVLLMIVFKSNATAQSVDDGVEMKTIETTCLDEQKDESAMSVDGTYDDDDDDDKRETKSTKRLTLRGYSPLNVASPESVSRFGNIVRLFYDGEDICWTTMAFFLLVFSLGIGTTLVESLVFLYFSEDLHASNLVCGVSVVVTVVFEFPLFYFSDTVLARTNVHVLNVIAVVAYVVRVVVYTLVPSPWFVLLVEPLHGVTYACHKLACVQYIADVTSRSKGLDATAQGMVTSAKSLGSFLGSFVGGIVMERYGSAAMYRGAAALVTIAASVYGAVVYALPPRIAL